MIRTEEKVTISLINLCNSVSKKEKTYATCVYFNLFFVHFFKYQRAYVSVYMCNIPAQRAREFHRPPP